MLTSKQYVRRFLALAALGELLLLALCAWADPYGCLRSTRGRHLPVYTNERLSKYLFSLHYIPENFDCVLIGPSCSNSLNPEEILPARVYNASLNGANACELQPIAHNFLERGSCRLLILCLSPTVVGTHQINGDPLKPSYQCVALGSSDFWESLHRRFRAKESSNWCGHDDLTATLTRRDPDSGKEEILQRGLFSYWHIDPKALWALRGIVEEAHAHGTRVVFFFAPVPESSREASGEHLVQFQRRVSACFREGDLRIDGNGPEFAEFRRDKANFWDGVHYSQLGARRLLQEIWSRVGQGG